MGVIFNYQIKQKQIIKRKKNLRKEVQSNGIG